MWSRFKYIEYPKEIRKNLIAREKKKRKEKISKGRKALRVILIVLLALILIAAGVFGSIWLRGRNNLHPNDEFDLKAEGIGLSDDTAPVVHDSGKRIEYKGEIYQFNENIVSFALIGVDKETLGTDYGKVGTGGQADTLALVLYDTATGKIRVAVIPRDTMVEINTYDVEGGYIDIKEQQICVAYAYGDGKESSCQNTMVSINRLLMGIPVDYYLAMDMDGIPALNDAIGGVTLTCLETEGRFTAGETVTLRGEDADAYVRDRNMNKLDADTARRARQKQYMEAFLAQTLEQIRHDFSLVTKLYNQAMPYVVTDITLDKVTYAATTALRNHVAIADYKTVPGTYVQGPKLAEYHVDKTALFEMILDLFYEKEL
ncbi:MAG: LCP family protein [Clostridia bacterium]|nr:LCP family protein [Clostridia bacterium]